jgi:hypothetical protein
MNLSLLDNNGLIKKLQMRPLWNAFKFNRETRNKSYKLNKTLNTIDKSDLSLTPMKGNKKVRDDLISLEIINKLKKKNELGGLMFKKPDFMKSNKTFICSGASILKSRQRNQSYNFEDSNNSKILSTIGKDNSILGRMAQDISLPITRTEYTVVITEQPVIAKDDFTFRDLSRSIINQSCIEGTRTIFEMKKRTDTPIKLKHNSLINTIKVKIKVESDLTTKQSFYKQIKLDPPKLLPKFTLSHKNTVNTDELNMSLNEYKIESRSTAVNESIRKSRDSPKLMIKHPHIRDFFQK